MVQFSDEPSPVARAVLAYLVTNSRSISFDAATNYPNEDALQDIAAAVGISVNKAAEGLSELACRQKVHVVTVGSFPGIRPFDMLVANP